MNTEKSFIFFITCHLIKAHSDDQRKSGSDLNGERVDKMNFSRRKFKTWAVVYGSPFDTGYFELSVQNDE